MTIERTASDVRQPVVVRKSVVEKRFSPQSKKELIDRFRRRVVRNRCHSEKDGCSLTLRKGWLTENNEAEDGGIEDFVGQL